MINCHLNYTKANYYIHTNLPDIYYARSSTLPTSNGYQRWKKERHEIIDQALVLNTEFYVVQTSQENGRKIDVSYYFNLWILLHTCNCIDGYTYWPLPLQ